MKLGMILYAIMLFSGAAQAFLATDEAAKFVAPEQLFWFRGLTSAMNVVATGLKAYTSDAFSRWAEAKKAGLRTGETEFIARQTGP